MFKIMINPVFASGYFYHIFNRGVEKRDIFLDKRDYLRFLETLDFYRLFPTPTKLSDFRRNKNKYMKNVQQDEIVKLYCYCLMPNHYHLLVQQLEESGITNFLRKLSDSYTKYFNTKYERIGPLFQGTFKARSVETDEYLLYLSKYIHKNSFLLKMWKGKIYPFSSYNHYLTGEIHPFCDTQFILNNFNRKNPNLDYKNFVEDINYSVPVLEELFENFGH